MWDNSDNGNDETNALLDKQIAESNADISRKKTALFNERLGIIKSSQGVQWEAKAPSTGVIR